MILRPANVKELAARLADASKHGQKLAALDLSLLDRVLEHTPEDMTATVEAGITLASLQTQLSRRGQWLPIDPPNPESTSIAAVLNTNASGPRRFGYGTIREHLIGLKVVLADGRVITAGGKVVKNVAGYDLCKLFVGSHGSLGIIFEATFKLRPLPEAEEFLQAGCASLAEAGQRIDAVLESELTPVVLDLHQLPAHDSLSRDRGDRPALSLVLGLAGTRAEVEWQVQKAGTLGWSERSNLEHESQFWSSGKEVRFLSVLPSRLTATLLSLGPASFVARAGNGAIFYRGGAEPAREQLPMELMRRIKETYDPKNILPGLNL